MKINLFLALLILGSCTLFCTNTSSAGLDSDNIISFEVDPQNQVIQFFHKNDVGEAFVNIGNLKKEVEGKYKELVFAMNGGMYNKDLTPQGLYIEKGEVLAPLDTLSKGYGNFYLQPNGVFYLDNNNVAQIKITSDFNYAENIKYATQSGPMLLIDGEIHSKFKEGSSNLHLRNGVGLLPDGKLLFAMSKERICFFDFASYFKSRGCANALYLDGFVSRMYLPTKNWTQLDGKYGIIIAVVQ